MDYRIESLSEFSPGWMKLASEGGTPKLLGAPGVEKSSISLLKMIPVCVEAIRAPKLDGSKNYKVMYKQQLSAQEL